MTATEWITIIVALVGVIITLCTFIFKGMYQNQQKITEQLECINKKLSGLTTIEACGRYREIEEENFKSHRHLKDGEIEKVVIVK